MSVLDEPGESVEELEQQMRQAEAEAPPAPTPEPEVEPQPDSVVEAKVPAGVLKAERERYRSEIAQTQSEMAALRTQLQEFQTLKDELNQQRLAAQQQQESTTFEQDPLGAMHERLRRIEEQQTHATQTAEQRQQQQHAEEQLRRTMAGAVQSYMAEQPDYQDALQHVVQTRAQQLRIQGIPEAQIAPMVEAESMQLAQQHGVNAPRVVYQYAQTLGYTQKPAPNKLQKIEEGQKASQTLSESQGAAASTEGPSLSDIERMSDEEFDAWSEKRWKEMRTDENRGR